VYGSTTVACPGAGTWTKRGTVSGARGVGADDCSPLALVMHSNRPAHVVFDISGWFTGGAAPGFVPATPTRLIDTREALGPPPR
jgi:hypothetical protein